MDNHSIVPLYAQSATQKLCFIAWSEFLQLAHLLSECIQVDGSPDVIIGLQRGGLIPAVCLSHQLGVRHFLALPVSRTTSDTVLSAKQPPSILPVQPDLLNQYITQKDVLVVDDIAGTGESVKEVFGLLTSFAPTRIRSAICVVNRENWDLTHVQTPTEILTYVGKEVYGWVVFPWEVPQGPCFVQPHVYP